MRRRWERLLIPLVALVLAASAGAGLAAAEGPYPPVPSDAELQQLANAAVAKFPTCGTTIPNGPAPALHVSCTDIKVSKWHSETSAAQNNDNWVLVTFKISTGVFPDGRTDVAYHILSAQILADTPIDLLTGGWPAQRKTNDWSDWIPSWLTPGWDLTTHHPWTPGPSASPELPLCDAAINVPGGLKAGDTLAPDATVTSTNGTPVQGAISMVWTINGTVTNSVAWDGNPARIVLQLSCQGHAQEFTASYNGTLVRDSGTTTPAESAGPLPPSSIEPGETAGPDESSAPTESAAPSPVPNGGKHGVTPGLGGVGTVPGPADPLSGLVGMVAPALLGILGGLLLGGGSGNAGGAGGAGGEGPVGPGGTGFGGSTPAGKEVGGGEGPKLGGPGADSPVGGGLTTQGAISTLALAMNQAVDTKNAAMANAINNAQADLLDASGNVIPEKYAAAIKAIREASGTDPKQINPTDFYDPNSSTDAAMKAGRDSWLGQKVIAGAGAVVGTASSVAHNLALLADSAWNWKYFLKGAEVATRNAAPEESQAMDTALSDGKYIDALKAGAMKYGKGYLAADNAVSKVRETLAVEIAAGILPVDEFTTIMDPHVSWAKKFEAYQSAEVKVGLLLLPVVGEIRGAGVAVDAARAVEATNAAAKTARSVEAARSAAAVADVVSTERMAAAVKSGQEIERLAATVLGDGAAPANLREGAQIVRRSSPELQAAIDNTIRENAGSDAIRMARQTGNLADNANNLAIARKMDVQNQAMNNAAREIARLEAEICQSKGLPVPARVQTFDVTEGSRTHISGANFNADLDRTFITDHVSSDKANEILANECEKLGGPGRPGFTPEDLGVHAYTARPGTLADTSGVVDAPLNDSFVRNNLGGIKSKSGFVPTYTAPPVAGAKNGVVTVGTPVNGALGSEALPIAERFGPPLKLVGEGSTVSAVDTAASVATQIGKLDAAVAVKDVNLAAKAAARAIKAGDLLGGPESAAARDAIMRAAAAKDPIEAMQILRDAGIDPFSDLQTLVKP